MARRFARRKPKVVWLPIFGDTSEGESGGYAQADGIRYNCIPGAVNPGISFDATAITWDSPQSATAEQGLGLNDQTLHDFVSGTEYRLRRIVGKVHVGCTTSVTTNITAVEVAFGFIVGRCDSNGALNTDFNETNPLYQDSATDPWIWRRTWILSPGYFPGLIGGAYPQTNAEYGSVADGPHIDQKTARVISRDERLLGILAARPIYTVGGDPSTGSVSVDAYLDYRLLASLRTNQGNRRNASR